MTQPRKAKRPKSKITGRFMSKAMDAFGRAFGRKVSGKSEAMLIEHDPKAQERNTTRSKGK